MMKKVGPRRGATSRGSLPSRTKIPPRPNLLAGEDLAPKPSQSRSRLRREALLHAALELFAREGFEAVGISEIAGHASVAVGGFYRHFRSKRQLLVVLMNELLQKLESIEMQPQGESLRGAIENVLRTGLATDLEYAGAYRAWREAMLADRELAALDAKVREWTTARLRAVFMRVLEMPNSRREMNVALFAALMDRLFWDLLGSSLVSRPEVMEMLAHIIQHSLLQDSMHPAH